MAENKQTWANLIRPDNQQPEKEGASSTWDKVAAGLSSIGNGLSGFAADAIGAGTSEFVSRALLGNERYSHEAAKQPEQEPDKDKEKEKDRDRDQGMER